MSRKRQLDVNKKKLLADSRKKQLVASKKRLHVFSVSKKKQLHAKEPTSNSNRLTNNSNKPISNNSKHTTNNRATNNRLTNSPTTRLVPRVLEYPQYHRSHQPLTAVPTSP